MVQFWSQVVRNCTLYDAAIVSNFYFLQCRVRNEIYQKIDELNKINDLQQLENYYQW